MKRYRTVALYINAVFTILLSVEKDISIFSYSSLTLRRIRDSEKINPATLRSKIQPKLQLIHDAVTPKEWDDTAAIYENNPEALKRLADRLDEKETRKWIKNWFKDAEIEYIQSVLRSYSDYSSADIEKMGGFTNLTFLALLHLWLERATATITHLPSMHGDGGAELLERFILSGKESAESQGKEFILLLEYFSLGANFFIRFLAERGLDITLEELFTEQQYREILREAFREEQRTVMSMMEDLNKGIIPPSIKQDPFGYRLFSIIINNRIKWTFEQYDFSQDTDLEAKRLTLLAHNVILKKIEDAVWEGDIDTALFQAQKFIEATLESMQIRDLNIIKQATGMARPDTYIQIVMGGGHQLTAKAENLIQIFREEKLPLYHDPVWEILRQRALSLVVEDEEEWFLRIFPSFFANYLMKKYSMYLPQIRNDIDRAKISAGVASRWEKEDCLNLAAEFRKGQGADTFAQIYFTMWIILHGTEEEKAIFKF